MTLALLYGYGTRAFGWFPGSFLDTAVRQAGGRLGVAHYVAPKVYQRWGVQLPEPGRIAPGLTLVSTHSEEGEWRPGLRLIDANGNSIHRWRTDPELVFPGTERNGGVRAANSRGVHGSYLFPNGDVIVNLNHIGVARLNACGDVLWRLSNNAHHSIARTDDGSFWIPVSGSAAIPMSDAYPNGYPGLDRPVNHDRLLRLTEDGEPRDTISVLDILFRNDLVRYLAKARVVLSTDYLHVNDVEPLPAELADEYPLFEAGDLLLSIRASDLVLVVDPETELVKWHASDPFVQQHDPDFIGGGWIGVFDNQRDGTDRGTLLGGSRVVAVQPHTDSLRVLFPTPNSEPLYTSILGKWQALENGNMLVTEGRAGRIAEVAPDGRTVWEWIHEPYDETHTVEVTEATRYPLTRDQVAAWRCASSPTENETIEEV